MTTGYAHNSTHTVAQGCTFAFDSRLLEDTELVVQVCSDNKVLLERTVAVKSLTYTQQTFFTSTLHFGGVRGTDKNSTAIPTITMVSFIAAHTLPDSHSTTCDFTACRMSRVTCSFPLCV